MPHAILLDVKREPELNFKYRLIGTYVAENLFKDYTGCWFSEIEHQKAPSQIWQNCCQVVEIGEEFKAGTPMSGRVRASSAPKTSSCSSPMTDTRSIV